MDAHQLRPILDAVAQGHLSPHDALTQMTSLTYEAIGEFAKIDHGRSRRTGFPEVIWGPGKTSDEIVRIMQTMREKTEVVMATRIEMDVFQQIRVHIPDVRYYGRARICVIAPEEPTICHPGVITLVTAGTADLAVAEEAAITAELFGFQVKRLWDVGVAGIHRLLRNQQVLQEADVLIVAAGMEGALPSVVAGLVDCPVIAVPTSVGYGTNFSGLAPLLTMLNSCAAGIGVMNIDNGFGAAILAGQILRIAEKVGDRQMRLKSGE
jgi:NCAIR mutase (PurE)-related protein